MRRERAIERLHAVLAEFSAVRFALTRLLEQAAVDPTVMRPALARRDLVAADAMLEATYLSRMFAEFEASSRSCFLSRKRGAPPMKDVMSSLASSCRMAYADWKNADSVRVERNAFVHDAAVPSIALPDALARLTRFMSHFPWNWK